ALARNLARHAVLRAYRAADYALACAVGHSPAYRASSGAGGTAAGAGAVDAIKRVDAGLAAGGAAGARPRVAGAGALRRGARGHSGRAAAAISAGGSQRCHLLARDLPRPASGWRWELLGPHSLHTAGILRPALRWADRPVGVAAAHGHRAAASPRSDAGQPWVVSAAGALLVLLCALHQNTLALLFPGA